MTAPGHGGGLGPTRARDLLVVFVVAALFGYALTVLNYSNLPKLPRLAGLSAALLGIGEAAAGWGLRRRIQLRSRRRNSSKRTDGPAAGVAAFNEMPAPVPPLVAARALAVAKASALAGAAFAGLWVGFGAYVLPSAADADAPAADSVTALVGLAGAVVLIGGALYLEYCCRTPEDGPTGRS